MIKYWKYILCFIVGILLMLLFIPKQQVKYIKSVKTDTIYVDKIRTIVIEKEKITAPNTLKISKTSNKPRRDSLEHQPIITGVKVSNDVLTVQKIDSTGVESEAEYKIEPTDKVTIDNESNVSVEPDKKSIRKEKRKKFLRIF